MPTMIAPRPNQVFGTNYPSGTRYTADAAGIISGVVVQDVPQLRNAGCEQVGVDNGLIGRLVNADMNVTTDQAIPMFIDASVPYRLTKISAKNASVSLTTAVGGVYPAVAKGGTAVVAAGPV
jgi:hypothetical protein